MKLKCVTHKRRVMSIKWRWIHREDGTKCEGTKAVMVDSSGSEPRVRTFEPDGDTNGIELVHDTHPSYDLTRIPAN